MLNLLSYMVLDCGGRISHFAAEEIQNGYVHTFPRYKQHALQPVMRPEPKTIKLKSNPYYQTGNKTLLLIPKMFLLITEMSLSKKLSQRASPFQAACNHTTGKIQNLMEPLISS